ncbi:CRISPR-associated endoribonuclease Cas6 [Cyanobacteria bacterium FACHB-63]|nr:CRISPR-associated endoribonuclease Cas6 [Cyanobacteria bacterium FACHB-63]
MPRKRQPILPIPPNTELIALTLTLQPQSEFQAPTHYTIELHSWFLNQVRLIDPDLSAYLHDGQSEKAFSLSSLTGNLQPKNRSLTFTPTELYQWSIAALSNEVCKWLQEWLRTPPKEIQLRSGTFTIQTWEVSLPATTYETIWNEAETTSSSNKDQQLSLTFTTATSFRKRGNHMPLPIPENIFHSYLRRWNNFAHLEFEQNEFLEWVNEFVVILRHDIRSQKTQAGKQGSVTGFIGAVQFGLTPKAQTEPEYVQLVHALIACAPYFSTGHKVTFGLGQTIAGWSVDRPLEKLPQATQPVVKKVAELDAPKPLSNQEKPSKHEAKRKQRQAELKQFFLSKKKRQGGERAEKAAEVWAAIVVRQESGEAIADIAAELDLPYDTVKQYAKRARKVMEEG